MEQTQIKHPWLAFTGILIATFMGLFSETALNIAIPTLERALAVPTATIQWLVTGYMMMIALIMPFNSLIFKRLGAKRLMQTALLIFLVGAIIDICATNFVMLLCGRLLQGIGVGMIVPLLYAVTLLLFAGPKLPVVMGINSVVILAAPVLGPTLTGALLQATSWRMLFALLAAIALVALIFVTAKLPQLITREHRQLDVLTVITAIIGFCGLVASSSLLSELGFSLSIAALFVVSLVAIFCYSKRQLSLDRPNLNLHLFKNGAFTTGVVVAGLAFAIVLGGLMYLIPQLLQNGLSQSSMAAGFWMIPGGLFNVFLSLAAGNLYAKTGPKKLMVSGAIIAIIGLSLFYTPLTTSAAGAALIYACTMLGLPLIVGPAQTYALAAIKQAESGDGSAIMNSLQQLIGAIVTALVTLALTTGQSHASGTTMQRFVAGMHSSAILPLLFIVVVLILVLRMKPKH